MNIKINYVRLERFRTNSWITYHLPEPMLWNDKLNIYLSANMPGWELVSGTIENPDKEEYINVPPC